MSTAFSAIKPFTVKAGQTMMVSLSGTWIDILDASLPSFKIILPGRETLAVQAGLAIPADLFSSFQIDNSANTSDLTVVLHVGNVSIGDRRAVKAAPLYAVGGAGITQNLYNGAINLGAAGSVVVTVPGVNAGNRRFQIVISCRSDSTRGINVFDSNNNLFVNIAPGNAYTFQTDATFVLKNDSGGTGAYAIVGELYYAPIAA